MRMFVAVRLPPVAVEDLEAFLEPRRQAADFRWAASDQWHLTLAFSDQVPERKLDELVERLERAAGKRTAMTAAVAGGGAFPNVGRARVLWTGLDVGDTVELGRLGTGCRAAMSKAGASVDANRFRAPLTVARMKQPVEATSWVRLLDGYRGPDWSLDSVALVASHLGEGPRNRARHEVVETFALGRP